KRSGGTRASRSTRPSTARARRTTRGKRRAAPCTACALDDKPNYAAPPLGFLGRLRSAAPPRGSSRPPRKRQGIEQHFGRTLSVGVEEEIWILDGNTLELTPAVATLVSGVDGRTLPGVLKTELHASVVELTNEVADTADQAVDRIGELREAAIDV